MQSPHIETNPNVYASLIIANAYPICIYSKNHLLKPATPPSES